jgi:preprotein translocase subunit SecD
MDSLRLGGVATAVCLGIGMLAPFGAASPDDKTKVTVEFKRAETKPADGLTEATIEGTSHKIYLPKRADATHSDIARASVELDPNMKPIIDIIFTDAGAKKMKAMTEKHRDKPLAIVVNGKVLSAPVVKTAIGDRAQINGNFTNAEAEKIVKAINEK